MKILVYTVSDFKSNALDCINLMISCFTKINFDFKIVTNKSEYKNNKDVIFDETSYKYIGFLKYSKNIPHGYDKYIYLDSDILYFDDVENLFSEKKYSCVIEELPMNHEWFLYKKHDHEYLEKIKLLNGFNAGTFSFEDINFLKQIRNYFEPYVTQDVHFDARLEQSSYNYALSKNINFDLNNIYDLTKITQLFADTKQYTYNKKLYHFCGFSNEMQSKFFKMKNFYDTIKR